MMDTDKPYKPPSPWVPMSHPRDLKALGKLAEELNECGSAVARCIIQGIYEHDPETGKRNDAWLEDEIADVFANAKMVCERFNLDVSRIQKRADKKVEYQRIWQKQM